MYEQVRRFWTRIFAVSVVVGTVTGIVLEFEFGTNFAAFATTAGPLFGGPLAVEGMMVFMLEATFLGVFVFGRERVGDTLYMISAVAVGLGTWLSAVWILVANSWMQMPRGYELVTRNGEQVIHLVDPVAAYATPRPGSSGCSSTCRTPRWSRCRSRWRGRAPTSSSDITSGNTPSTT